MPCLLALLALATPRLVIAILWLFTHWFRGAFHSHVAPAWMLMLLGFVFLPTTLLWYVAVEHWFAGVWGPVPIIGLVFALMIDLSPASARRRRVEL